MKTIEAVEKQKGSSLALTLYLADLALRAPQPEKALQALQKAYATSSDAALKTKIAHQMGIIYFDQQNGTLHKKH